MVSEKLIHVLAEDLGYRYPGEDPVINGLNLMVRPGEKVGVIGPNGSGKTTLFLLLAGILSPESGEISILREPVRAGHHNRNLGFIFQNPDDQLFCPSVREDMAFGLLNLGCRAAEADSLVNDYLENMGMSELSERPPHKLSGGEKRMISIAGVMIMNPSVVLLDEPESSLDCRSRRNLIEFLNRSENTLLIASHDLEFLLETCSRTVLIDTGSIQADGPSREIMGNRILMEKHGFEKPHSLVPHAELHHSDRLN